MTTDVARPNSRTTFVELESATLEFFKRHWVSQVLGMPPLSWRKWESFLSGSVPYHDTAGCYALFEDAALIYVGLGASRGGGIYDGYGLSRRLMGHVICADRGRGVGWSKLTSAWSTVTELFTLGFSKELSYVAASLETHLIRQLKPPRNGRV
jgi:hypothetical protein